MIGTEERYAISREVCGRPEGVVFALEIRRADGESAKSSGLGQQPDSVRERASALSTITLSANECNSAFRSVRTPSLISFEPSSDLSVRTHTYGSDNPVSGSDRNVKRNGRVRE